MEQTIEYQEVIGNRTVKSTLFPNLFADKKELLELFNAVNGTDYQDSDDFEINTIEGILYMTTKNDVSFLVESTMNLYEQQSTYNPNMPLRGFLYFAQLYHKFINSRRLNIYGTKLQKIPVPHYVVFYNGTQDEPDEKILKDFLIENKSEVLEMVLYSFDKELYENDLKQTAFEEGEQQGIQQGIRRLVQKKLAKGKSIEAIAEDLEESVEAIEEIIRNLKTK